MLTGTFAFPNKQYVATDHHHPTADPLAAYSLAGDAMTGIEPSTVGRAIQAASANLPISPVRSVAAAHLSDSSNDIPAPVVSSSTAIPSSRNATPGTSVAQASSYNHHQQQQPSIVSSVAVQTDESGAFLASSDATDEATAAPSPLPPTSPVRPASQPGTHLPTSVPNLQREMVRMQQESTIQRETIERFQETAVRSREVIRELLIEKVSCLCAC